MREMRVFPATLGTPAIVTLQSQFALAIEAVLRLGNFPPAGCGIALPPARWPGHPRDRSSCGEGSGLMKQTES